MSTSANGIDRFWGKVSIAGPDDCWEWQGAISSNGYGAFWSEGKMRGAHRFAYESQYGPISSRVMVCHHCDNRRCVNPAHLFVGSQLDNMADEGAKGRRSQGERHYRSSITATVAIAIADAFREGQKMSTIARAFGVSHNVVWPIVHGRNWSDVTGIVEGGSSSAIPCK